MTQSNQAMWPNKLTQGLKAIDFEFAGTESKQKHLHLHGLKQNKKNAITVETKIIFKPI